MYARANVLHARMVSVRARKKFRGRCSACALGTHGRPPRGKCRHSRGNVPHARKNGRVEESPDEVLARLKRYVEEESPEEVLARLERYAASLRSGPPVSRLDRAAPPIGVETPAASKPEPAVDTFIPSRTQPVRLRSPFVSEVAPAVLAVLTCAFVILAFELLDPVVAAVVAAVLGLVGVIGLVQRVPLARSLTIGLVVAGLLIRFS